jgi:hypothetical protein
LAGLREIEVDAAGNAYVLNAHYGNRSDVLWRYAASGGLIRAELGNPTRADYLPDPIGLHVSNTCGVVYVGSGQVDESEPNSTRVCGFDMTSMALVRQIKIHNMEQVTGMTEDTAGNLWVTGFNIARHSLGSISSWSGVRNSFYEAFIAVVPLGATEVNAISLEGVADLALPLSVVWTGP